MQRYFVKRKENDTVFLEESDFHHVKNVMRMNVCDNVEVVFNNKVYLASIISLDNVVKCKIIKEIETLNKDIPNIVIAQALVKEQKMDYILQKSCELGVDKIIPLITDRSVVKIDKNDTKKIDRWQKIVKEASEQSKRAYIPKVENIMTIKDLANLEFTHKYICSVNEKSKTIKSVLSNVNACDTIIFVIGPEGGLSKEEESFLEKNGFKSVSFGNRVLRTETASLFIMSAVSYEFLR